MDQWSLNTVLYRKVTEEVLLVATYNSMLQSNARTATFDANYETKVSKALARVQFSQAYFFGASHLVDFLAKLFNPRTINPRRLVNQELLSRA